MDTDSDLLRPYAAERDALLQRVLGVIEGDQRVRAGWLWGSFGRGEQDALSDIDLWLAVADEELAAIAGVPQAFVEACGPPLITVAAPQNAPERGAYLLAIYAGQHGPHQVDWYWQAESAARVPAAIRPFLERGGLPRTEAPPAFPGGAAPEPDAPERRGQKISFFWAMALIAAKHIARSPAQTQRPLLAFVHAQLAAAQAGLAAAAPLPIAADSADPLARLAVLRQLAAAMTDLRPSAIAAGAPFPAGIEPQAERYFALIERIIRDRIPLRA
ncbi:MAG TPA: hypothetical protein VD886_02410 [Herpetosiphonaceae bacterium]|nr:hypothetical protein [Herpetosiphonaceae bacterium]